MTFMDMMPWRRGRGAAAGAIDNVRGLVETMERALEEPWAATGARLLGSDWSPRMDVRETEKEVVVEAALPELDKKDIHVSASEDTLSIRGVKRAQDQSYTFYRSFTLPATVRADDVKASYKDGLLTVILPKAKHSQIRRVSIG